MNKAVSVYLDLLRIIAAFAVFFTHAHNFTNGHFSALSYFSHEAIAGFFVLSGLVISYVTDRRETSASEYAIARLARVYSVAIPALIVTFTFDAIGLSVNPALYAGQLYFNPQSGFIEIFRYLTFTNELWNNHIIFGSDEPYWSLGFEGCYYFAYGLFIYLPFSRIFKTIITAIFLIIVGPKISLYFGLWLLGVYLYKYIAFSEKKVSDASSSRSFVWWGVCLLAPVAWFLIRKIVRSLHLDAFNPMYMPFELSQSELAGKNWTDFGGELRCGIAPRMVRNQGDRNGEHTEEAYGGV